LGHSSVAARSCVIGVTGGIASGKSVVVRELERLGAVTFSADEIARRIVEPDGPAYRPVVEAFGSGILDEAGRLNRAALAQRIFADSEARRTLDAIMHPIILAELRRAIEAFRLQPAHSPPIAVAEIPLLYETGAEGMVDKVLVTALEPCIQLSRLKQRNSWSEAQALAAIQSQIPLSEKAARADWVIRTDGSLEETLSQTRAFWNQITQPLKEESPCP
jgi:dephospho-CoA kinase